MEDYEIFAPDEDDEFYDKLCEAAWANMFSEGWYSDVYCMVHR